MYEGGAQKGLLDLLEGSLVLVFPLIHSIWLGQFFQRKVGLREIRDEVSVIVDKAQKALQLLLVPGGLPLAESIVHLYVWGDRSFADDSTEEGHFTSHEGTFAGLTFQSGLMQALKYLIEFFYMLFNGSRGDQNVVNVAQHHVAIRLGDTF